MNSKRNRVALTVSIAARNVILQVRHSSFIGAYETQLGTTALKARDARVMTRDPVYGFFAEANNTI